MLADSATVREGLLHALGLGINHIGRESFPSALNAVIVVALERRPEDDGVVELHVRAEVRSLDSTSEQLVFEADGSLRFDSARVERSFYVPIVLESQAAMIPGPGAYEVKITIGKLDQVDFQFFAEPLAPAPGEAEASDPQG